MQVMTPPTILNTFASVAEAVAYWYAHGYDTVLENPCDGIARVMRGAMGDYLIVRHNGLLDVDCVEDGGYWEEKIADWSTEY